MVVAIENVSAAINQIAQTTLRAVVGRHSLETLSETDMINHHREILDVQTEEWRVKVTVVELNDIQLWATTRSWWPPARVLVRRSRERSRSAQVAGLEQAGDTGVPTTKPGGTGRPAKASSPRLAPLTLAKATSRPEIRSSPRTSAFGVLGGPAALIPRLRP